MSRRSLAATLATIYTAKLGLNTAARFVYPFLPAIARGMGVSLEAAGLLVSVRWLAGLATPVVVRLVAPGEQRRRLALVGCALGAAGAAVTTSGLFGLAVAGFVLMGVGKPLADVAFQAFVADEVPYRSRGRAVSLIELAWGSALLIGAPVAGWLLTTWSWRTPFAALALLVAVVMVPLTIRMTPTRSARPTPTTRLRLDTSMVAFLAAGVAFAFAAELAFVVFGAWLEDSFDVSLVALGGAAAVIAIGELTGEGVSVGWSDRLGKRRMVVTGLAVSSLGYLGVIASTSYGAGLIAFTIALAGFEMAIVSSIPLATELSPGSRARFLALMVMVLGVARAIGSAIGVPIYTSIGLAGNLGIATVANAVAALVLIRWVREGTGEPAPVGRSEPSGPR